MNNKAEILKRLETTDQVFNMLFPNEHIRLYIVGGIGCILNDVSVRPTMGFDFIEYDYHAKYLRALNTIGDFDFIDTTIRAIPLDYSSRAKIVFSGKNIKAYVLSSEDIIVMKLNRYNDIDKDDIKMLLKKSDRALLIHLIESSMAKLDHQNALDCYQKNYENFLKEVLGHV